MIPNVLLFDDVHDGLLFCLNEVIPNVLLFDDVHDGLLFCVGDDAVIIDFGHEVRSISVFTSELSERSRQADS